jgi:hypothetical protein
MTKTSTKQATVTTPAPRLSSSHTAAKRARWNDCRQTMDESTSLTNHFLG